MQAKVQTNRETGVMKAAKPPKHRQRRGCVIKKPCTVDEPRARALVDLVAGVVHDFDNLLTVIHAAAEHLDNLVASHPAYRKDLDLIRSAADQAARIAHALLVFSGPEAIHKTRIDLRMVLKDAVRMIQRLLPASIQLRVDTQLRLPVWISGDSVQLQQMLLNLAINARDAMPTGGRLTIRLSRVHGAAGPATSGNSKPSGRLARLEIIDTGQGIPAEIREKVFAPFFTTKTRKGKGLGLSNVERIVRDHDGSITLNSSPGEGTVVVITLPCIASPASARSVGQVNARIGKGELILLAEADPYVNQLMAAGLRSAGYRVLACPEPPMLLSAATQHRDQVRLCLLDSGLAASDGRRCVEALRRLGLGAPILLTDDQANIDRSDRPDAGTYRLSKPFQLSDLTRVVTQLLQHRPGQDGVQ